MTNELDSEVLRGLARNLEKAFGTRRRQYISSRWLSWSQQYQVRALYPLGITVPSSIAISEAHEGIRSSKLGHLQYHEARSPFSNPLDFHVFELCSVTQISSSHSSCCHSHREFERCWDLSFPLHAVGALNAISSDTIFITSYRSLIGRNCRVGESMIMHPPLLGIQLH